MVGKLVTARMAESAIRYGTLPPPGLKGAHYLPALPTVRPGKPLQGIWENQNDLTWLFIATLLPSLSRPLSTPIGGTPGPW